MYWQQGSFYCQIHDPKPSERAAKLAERQASTAEVHSSNKPSKEDCRRNRRQMLDFNREEQPTTGEGELMKPGDECWMECLLPLLTLHLSDRYK